MGFARSSSQAEQRANTSCSATSPRSQRTRDYGRRGRPGILPTRFPNPVCTVSPRISSGRRRDGESFDDPSAVQAVWEFLSAQSPGKDRGDAPVESGQDEDCRRAAAKVQLTADLLRVDSDPAILNLQPADASLPSRPPHPLRRKAGRRAREVGVADSDRLESPRSDRRNCPSRGLTSQRSSSS